MSSGERGSTTDGMSTSLGQSMGLSARGISVRADREVFAPRQDLQDLLDVPHRCLLSDRPEHLHLAFGTGRERPDGILVPDRQLVRL